MAATHRRIRAVRNAAIKSSPKVMDRACHMANPASPPPMTRPVPTRRESRSSRLRSVFSLLKRDVGGCPSGACSTSRRNTKAGGIVLMVRSGQSVKRAVVPMPSATPLSKGWRNSWGVRGSGRSPCNRTGRTIWRLTPSPAPTRLPMAPISRLCRRYMPTMSPVPAPRVFKMAMVMSFCLMNP